MRESVIEDIKERERERRLGERETIKEREYINDTKRRTERETKGQAEL
jgi:hypothetical protein